MNCTIALTTISCSPAHYVISFGCKIVKYSIKMNQADVSKLMSQLRIAIRPRHRNLKNKDGPEGRLLKLRKTVTALVKHERIELFYNRADEARGYAELVSRFSLLKWIIFLHILFVP